MTDINVNTSNPLTVPYRTGSYLISDVGASNNFRSAMALTDHPYRASGSHQLGLADFVSVLSQIVSTEQPSRLFLVDLREETHGYFNGVPVSWYSDNDFGNVGMSKEMIVSDERTRLKAHESRQTQLFTITDDANDDLKQERVLPVGYEALYVGSARTEAEVAEILGEVFKPTKVEYIRIPVTDHCAPSRDALRDLIDIERRAWPNDWAHFHCHGGDGRTSTSLALYDMLCWKRLGDPLPTLEEFCARQCQLFSYCLDPDGCTNCGKTEAGWKLSLAQERWKVLGEFLAYLLGDATDSFGPR